MGMIPKTTKAEQKLSIGFFNFTLGRILGIFITFAVASMFARLMPKVVGLIFIIVCLVLYFILTSKAPSNPRKTFAEGLFDFILYKITPKKLYSTKSSEWQNSEKLRKEKNDAKKRNKKSDK